MGKVYFSHFLLWSQKNYWGSFDSLWSLKIHSGTICLITSLTHDSFDNSFLYNSFRTLFLYNQDPINIAKAIILLLPDAFSVLEMKRQKTASRLTHER